MKVLLIMLATLVSMNAQAMRWDDKDRESTNVEDRRHPIYNLPADKLVQVCEKGYHTSYIVFKNAYGSVEKSKAIGVKATVLSLEYSANMLKRIPKAISPTHPQFPMKCAVGAKLVADVAALCECSAPQVHAACEAVVAALNDGGFQACLQK